MAKYLINKESGVPTCPICGATIPDCGPNGINIISTDIHYCYKCGVHMDIFYHSKGENK